MSSRYYLDEGLTPHDLEFLVYANSFLATLNSRANIRSRDSAEYSSNAVSTNFITTGMTTDRDSGIRQVREFFIFCEDVVLRYQSLTVLLHRYAVVNQREITVYERWIWKWMQRANKPR